MEDGPSSIVARKAYEGAEFLASTDERFRPVYLSSAPDGTLYLADMYRGIIQHKGYITEYLHRHILQGQLAAPSGEAIRDRVDQLAFQQVHRECILDEWRDADITGNITLFDIHVQESVQGHIRESYA